MYKQITTAALFAAGVSAHGRVTSPPPRPLGDAMSSSCGMQVWNQMSSDPNGNIQTMAQVGASQSDFDAAACHLWQCRGYQFADATADTIQSFSAGQVIPVSVTVAAPHTGVANVSIINLATNSVIGTPLADWSVYASVATGVTANDTSFSITMPDTLDAACETAGGCALQWWWDARSIDQTYMSCVDFTFSGSSSSSSSSSGSSSAAASPSVVPSSTLVAVSSAAEVAATTAPATAAATTPASDPVTTTLATVVVSTAGSSAAAEPTDDSSTCTKKRMARRAALAAADAARLE
ncbi:unnamed protein product [Discula destructiva]